MDFIVSAAADSAAAFRSLSFLALYFSTVLGVLYAVTGLGVRRG